MQSDSEAHWHHNRFIQIMKEAVKLYPKCEFNETNRQTGNTYSNCKYLSDIISFIMLN